MATTKTTEHSYTGDGSTTDYSVSFEYLKEDDVKVTLDHVATTAYSFVNATTLRFTTAPGNGVAIRIYRDTDVDAARFVFASGSALKAGELNENLDQLLYADQEKASTDNIADQAVTTAKIRDANVTTAKLADANITTAKLADGNVTTAKIAADAVNGTKIADDSINSEHYVDGSIDTAHIADAQVTTAKIAADAVTGSKLAHNSVNSEHYVTGSIDHDHIGDAQVTTAKIADVNVTTAKIANDAVTAAKLADNAVVTDNIVDANVTTAKIADDAVTTDKIADAELVELATMGGNTASALADLTQAEVQILDGATVTTAELNILDGVTATATELNQLDGNTLKASSTDFTSSSQFPAASEIDARITARIDPLGGFEAIADEDSFPATAPPAGTVVSIANANGLAVNSSGVGAGTRAGGSDAVVINGFPSTFNSTSLDDGIGLLVIATSTAHTYDFHRVVAKNEDVRQLSSDINDFKARYRIGSSNPTTDNDAGDLFFNTGTSKMLVYNASSSAWEEVQAVGDFFINTLSSSSGTGGGSATFNGSAYRFTLSNAPTYAQQLLVSINGVVQKPNSGTSQPSEGFAVDGGDIILAAAPATGSNAFFITIGSSVGIGTPSDSTISTAKIIDDAVTSAKIATLDANLQFADSAKAQFGAGNDLQIYHDGSDSYIADTGTGKLHIRGNSQLVLESNNGENYLAANENGDVHLYYDGGVRVSTTSGGANIVGELECDSLDVDGGFDIDGGKIFYDASADNLHFGDNVQLRIGTSSDFQIYHDGSASYIADNGTGNLNIQTNGSAIAFTKGSSENLAKFITDGAVELYHDNSKKLETTSSGVKIGAGSTVTPDANADVFVIDEGAADTGLSILSTTTGRIYFGDAADDEAGSIRYVHSDDSMRFETSSSERFRIGNDGKVYFGDFSSAAAAGYIDKATSGSYELDIVASRSTSTNRDIRFFSRSNQESMRLDTNGNLGIGTTSITEKLTVFSNNDSSPVDNGLAVYRSAGDDKVNINCQGGAARFISDGGSSYIPTRFSRYNGTAFVDDVTIDNSGRLLVGTTTAREHLNDGSDSAQIILEGTTQNTSTLAVIRSSNNDGPAHLVLGKSRGGVGSTTVLQDNDTIGHINFEGADGSHLIRAGQISCVVDDTPGGNDMPGRLSFSVTNNGSNALVERMRINSKGFLKVGPRITDSSNGVADLDSVRHEFTSDNNGWTIIVTHTSGAASEHEGILINYANSPNGTGNSFIQGNDSNGLKFRFASNGGLYNYQGNDSNLCDQREKKNIVNLESKWDKVKSWDLKKFHYNEDADEDDLRYGVIAQQVEEHCPEVLTEWIKQPAKEAVLDDDDNVVTPAVAEVTRKGVKEQQMMWMAIKALQEAQTRIETLETQNASLEARLTALEGGS